jgi:hypothetical protein
MRQTRVVCQQKVLVSFLILLVVGLHAIPVMFRKGRTQSYWPFLMWSMYKDSRSAGPIEARETRIIGLTSRGTTELLTPDLIGLPRATVRELYLKKMLASDSTAARQLFSRVNANRKEPVVEIRIVSNTIGLTDSGIVRHTKPVLSFRADTSHHN